MPNTPATRQDLHDELVTHRELLEEAQDLRMEQATLLQKQREEWRGEVHLELKSFKNEMRLLLLAGVVLLKFDFPSKITAASLGTATVYAVGKAVFARFGS